MAEEHDFIERNGTWLLSAGTLIVGCFATTLTYVLRSRCSKIKCCGFVCEREVLNLDASQTTIPNPSSSA